jgi:hypothetical protein
MRRLITHAIIVLAAGFAIGAPLLASANDMMAQVDKEPQRGPEVMPNLDNPNNPALPNSTDTSPSDKNEQQNEHMRQVSPQQPDASAQQRARCGTLTEPLARRHCLEELQRGKSN